MPNPVNLRTITGTASSTKDMRLSIQVHGDEFINMDSRPMPVFYSTLECLAVIRATVTLETDEECAGNDVEIIYKACATYKAPVRTVYAVYIESDHVFQKKRWLMDLDRPKEGKVAQGKYTKSISATIDPLWPSSARTSSLFSGQGWIKYVFEAKFTKQTMGVHNQLLFDSQEVWVLNSTLPSPETQLLAMDGQPPLVVRDTWKKSTLPIILTLPSEILTMAQVVPITVRMDPLTSKSKYAGQAVVVLGAHFALREHVLGRANGSGGQKFEGSHDVITVPLKDGWPRTAGPWERTVSLTMPTTPQVAVSAKTKWMDITHSLVLVMKIKAESEKDIKAEQFELKANIQIVVPRRTHESGGDFLPAYTNQASLDFEQIQYHDIKA
ncbi:hypothetical protein EDD21DRAFT_448962 [Dissophora ornata]|nr:hypothetical protein BGZ58_000488 [Dissophora ornata]KAI8595000.1 hypothetical protein EDD21DRAFT_448962 [Dissophora ornata]